jgi:hypothetical protein
MVGLLVYWEAMASFFTSQSLDAISYLDVFCEDTSTMIHPNPWTGASTSLFVYLAKTGTLIRQRSLLNNLSSITRSASAKAYEQLMVELVQYARRIEILLLQYEIPASDRIQDTRDPLTLTSHIQRLAQIYRLAALLELYRNFPIMLHTAPALEMEADQSWKDKLSTMATAILSLIAGIPRASGVNCLLTIPLIIAGSTLQRVRSETPRNSPAARDKEKTTEESWDILAAEILSIPSNEDTQLYWRDAVRERLRAVHSHVGLAPVGRALDILENVWARADVQEPGAEFVQWTEVMVGERLETILG